MRRETRGTTGYWNKWISFYETSIDERWQRLQQNSGDPIYRPQYVFDLSKKYLELMIERYSRGDNVNDISNHFHGRLDAWEESERLGKAIWSEEVQYTRHAWAVNIDHYIRCFWLTGLALTLKISDEEWSRLVDLMGNEGEDALLDRVIATRQPSRKIGDKLCFPKAYQGLMFTIEADKEKQPAALRSYLDNWFPSLKGAGSQKVPAEFRTPWWWDFCADESLGMKGGYFGCWCIEAVAVVKAFGIDDGLCLDHPNYPGDLLLDGRCPRYEDPVVTARELPPFNPPKTWFERIFRKS